MYGNSMVNKSVTDLMQDHRFIRQVESNEISEFDTYPMLKAISKLPLGPAHIDVGKLVVKFQNADKFSSKNHNVRCNFSNICRNLEI